MQECQGSSAAGRNHLSSSHRKLGAFWIWFFLSFRRGKRKVKEIWNVASSQPLNSAHCGRPRWLPEIHQRSFSGCLFSHQSNQIDGLSTCLHTQSLITTRKKREIVLFSPGMQSGWSINWRVDGGSQHLVSKNTLLTAALAATPAARCYM